TFVVLAVGALLGYAAASGRLSWQADAAPSSNPAPSKFADAVPPAPAERPAGCCMEGDAKGILLGQARKAAQEAPAGGQKPNILVIMGDDIGWFNIGAYHRGMMSGKTPNLDKLAKEGMLFTDYYAEASCTAGRANFITGEIPLRTGLTTVGQAGADV